MYLRRALSPVVFVLCTTAALPGQDKKGADELPLAVANGVVEKADKDTLVVKPRGPDGRFQKALTLKVAGTSKVTVLSPQKRGEKVVLTQRETEAKDLVPGQPVAVIYAEAGKDGPVLLSAVAQPGPGK
ncbi:MAG: hypothetical protein JWO38_800 [Gemmataceae bacterium]|nr:hypothetical protein [Gemmataceae bacterium]